MGGGVSVLTIGRSTSKSNSIGTPNLYFGAWSSKQHTISGIPFSTSIGASGRYLCIQIPVPALLSLLLQALCSSR